MTEKPSSAKIALKWGAILGLALMLYSSLNYTANLTTNTAFGLVSYALIIGGLVLAMREFRTLNGGYMTFGEGVGLGALTSAVSGLLSGIYNVVYTTVIDPGVMDRATEQVRAQLETQGKLTDEQIEQSMTMAKSFQSPGVLLFVGVLGSVILGVLLSLVIAAVMRRQNQNPFA
jgi:hypothetical protein